ncbi:sialate O-acetylesterase [Neptunicella marina]|uniref:Glycoside hydrolase n=1 Tax=Neptunicella marina TaxID=2125989 RepID=A0A8J6IUJ8_9ALTE|nr:sialate O-acetylesterase [Neptunicella marina]MBC3766187.1 glycoside hydrolase [Neptunicella marina]
MRKFGWSLGLFLMTFFTQANASVQLAALFNDHMVLQRDKQLHFWGTASPNQSVTLSFNHQSATVNADAKGNWKLTLPAMPKGGPFQLELLGERRQLIKDVYLGDVWIAGGQSNMEWKLDWGIDDLNKELEDSNYPLIRFFEVPNTQAASPQSMIPESQWKMASRDTVGNYSAVAWFFAKLLHKQQDVAVGIIDSNWGGTPAEAWVDARKLVDIPAYQALAQKTLNNKDWPQILQDNEQAEQLKFSRIGDTQLATNILKQSNDKQWRTLQLPNKQPLNDFVWIKRSVELDQLPNSPVTLNMGELVQEALVFINGKLLAQKSWNQADALFELPANAFQPGANTIALRVVNSWDNNVMLGKDQQMWLQIAENKIDLQGEWLFSNTLEAPMPKVTRYNWLPGFLYNAMIYPVLPYAIKGVIWYQGENNVAQHQDYHAVFSALIKNWRERANDPGLPFLFVQLAAYLPHKALQPKSEWAYLRDAQKQTLALDNTGMAVTIDIGNQQDIHPRNKQDVGMRLWLQAQNIAYGLSTIASGPAYKAMHNQGNSIKLEFDFAEGLGSKDNTDIKGFIIAGEDRQFYPATARVENGYIVVNSNKVPNPVAVRYAWADYPEVNLVNTQGLPAVPFRTDNWPADQIK